MGQILFPRFSVHVVEDMAGHTVLWAWSWVFKTAEDISTQGLYCALPKKIADTSPCRCSHQTRLRKSPHQDAKNTQQESQPRQTQASRAHCLIVHKPSCSQFYERKLSPTVPSPKHFQVCISFLLLDKTYVCKHFKPGRGCPSKIRVNTWVM